jgi:hypothetical protein
LNVFSGPFDIPDDSILRPSTYHEEINMTYRNTHANKLTIRVAALATATLLATAGHAQVNQPTYQAPPQAYPQGAPPAQYAPPAAPKAHPIRDLFAGTLAAVLQTATGGLVGAVNGRLTDWFARKSGMQNQGFPAQGQGFTGPAQSGGYPQQAATYPAPATAYPQQTATYPAPAATYPAPATGGYPAAPDPAANAYPPANNYPQAGGYPPAASDPNATNAYGAAPNPYGAAPTQVYDARTGQVVTSNANNPYAAVPAAGDNNLYAGVAYEVHALGVDGSAVPINAATYEFRTGDKFKVFYRPSLPGRMEVYNVNPAGQQTLIDASNMAAGQLTELGPYQFANLKGDESLRLVLSPCSSPQLLAATRDIVRVDGAQPGAGTAQMGNGVQLSNCGAPTTRGLKRVRTRDIQKVAVDGSTSYALDPVSQQEQNSGQVGAREVTIVFHHR